MTDAALTARVATFVATGTLSTTQDLVRAVLPALTTQANLELVAEETLVLTATVSARAAEVGLKHQPDALAALGPALAELPFLYHDYLLGAQLVAQGAEGDQEPDQSVYDRLARKAEFYAVHLAPGAFPGPRQLGDKMALWMGRISPPKLPTSPQARLESLGLVDLMASHARLVLAFAQKASSG